MLHDIYLTWKQIVFRCLWLDETSCELPRQLIDVKPGNLCIIWYQCTFISCYTYMYRVYFLACWWWITVGSIGCRFIANVARKVLKLQKRDQGFTAKVVNNTQVLKVKSARCLNWVRMLDGLAVWVHLQRIQQCASVLVLPAASQLIQRRRR